MISFHYLSLYSILIRSFSYMAEELGELAPELKLSPSNLELALKLERQLLCRKFSIIIQCFSFKDDGKRMDPKAMRRCLSFGFSDKSSVTTIGKYGNGFKTSSIRLGADVIVFSRVKDYILGDGFKKDVPFLEEVIVMKDINGKLVISLMLGVNEPDKVTINCPRLSRCFQLLGIVDFYNLVLPIQLDTAGDVTFGFFLKDTKPYFKLREFKIVHLGSNKVLEYDLWLMRIEQYFLMTDYSLWEVILNGYRKVLEKGTSSTNSNSNTNEVDNTAYGVSAAHTQSNPTSGDNLKQINPDDLEEIDLQWELAKMLQIELEVFMNVDMAGSWDMELEDMIRATKLKKSILQCINGIYIFRKFFQFLTSEVYCKLLLLLASPCVRKLVNSSKMLENQEYNKSKSDKGYHVVPPPYTGNFIPFKPDLTFTDEIVESENLVDHLITAGQKKTTCASSEPNITNAYKKDRAVVSENKAKGGLMLLRPQLAGFRKPKTVGNPQQKEYKEKGVIDSGCSRHMTGNRCYFTEYEDYDGGFVSFGDGKGRISGKGKIKTGTLYFDNVYFCKELKYNLFSVSQICDKKNNVLFTDTECLVSYSDFKLLDESQVLLRVPRKDNIYSVDLKSVVSTKGLTCLFAKVTVDESNLWHWRLGHINFKNMNKLVRGNLVRRILPSKIFENDLFFVLLVRGKQHKAFYVTMELEFKNSVMNQFYEMKRIKREFSVARTPQQNGVAERRNRTLIEAARTITSYELIRGKEPPLIVFYETLLGVLYLLKYQGSSRARIEGKSDEGFFVGHAEKNTEPEQEYILIPICTIDPLIFIDPKKVWTTGVYSTMARGPLEQNGSLGTKWVFRKKKDEKGTIVRNNARLVAQGYTQEEGIDYDEVFSLVARIEAIRCMCANQDLQFPDKVYKVEKALYGLHQAPRAWYETFSTYLIENGFRRGTIDKTLFIKKDKGDIFQDKYVADILKKFDYVIVKTTSTPLETNKALVKDEEAEAIVVHLYRSMIGSLMYLTASRPDIMFAVCACARDSPFDLEAFSDSDYARASLDRKSTIGGCQFLSKRLISWQCKKQTIVANSTTKAEYVVATNCYRQLIIHIEALFEGRLYGTMCISTADSTSWMLRMECKELPSDENGLILFWNTATSKTVYSVKQIHAIVDGKAVVISESSVRNDLLFDDEDGNEYRWQSQAPRNHGGALAQTRSERVLEKTNEPPLPEGHTSRSVEGSIEHTFELMDIVLDLEKEKDAQAMEILKLKQRVKKLERKRKSSISHPRRRIYRQVKSSDNDLDEEDASKQRRKSDKTKSMFKDSDFDVLDDDMENVEGETVNTATTGVSVVRALVTTVGVAISTAEPRTPPTTAATAFIDDELTIAQTLVKIRSKKAKEKGVAFRDVEETPRLTRSTTTLQPLPTIDPKDKELAQRLHKEELAELDRAQKEKQKQEEATNAALAEEFDEIQSRMDVDHELAVRLTHEEQEKYIIEERATLLAEYFERRKKQLAAKRAEEIRNKPPTRAQVRNRMITYLKYMGKYTHQQLKHKTLEELQKLYQKEQK
ncbi:putative ribonuclease H-like domain-containing protein [Tanacetum coccineum]